MQSISKTWKENPWKVLTVILAGLIILLIINVIIEINKSNKEEEKRICSNIEATPAWVNYYGGIEGYGVITINKSSKEFSDNLTELLITERLKFVYNSDCSACQLQIQIFGEGNFNKLKQEKLTLDCSKLNNGGQK